MIAAFGLSCASTPAPAAYATRSDALLIRRPPRMTVARVGQPQRVLVVSPSAAPMTAEHVVTRGETLSGIARTYYGDPSQWPAIAARNPQIDPNKLLVGQRLTLP